MTCQTKPLDITRNCFGILDQNKQKYPDILSSFLELRRLYASDLEDGLIIESKDRGKEYHLLVDQHIINRIKNFGIADCIISFQIRTNNSSEGVFYAVARLFNPDKVQTKDSI